jgi:hypothetical protein
MIPVWRIQSVKWGTEEVRIQRAGKYKKTTHFLADRGKMNKFSTLKVKE